MSEFKQPTPNQELLKELAWYEMPFGKYKHQKIKDLPVPYLEWFARKGFPDGKLGMLMSTVHVIKTNGLEEILHKINQWAEEE